MNLLQRRAERETELAPSEIAEFLVYEPETGVIRWKADKGRAKAGQEAGGLRPTGYRVLEIFGLKYQAHRVAWALSFGRWPEFDIDHINGDRADNRLSNLREASRGQNCANRKARKGAVSGVKGVWWHKANRKWVAGVGRKYLGSFETLAEAEAAYRRAATELHGEFARPS